jgi:hypothetical protein
MSPRRWLAPLVLCVLGMLAFVITRQWLTDPASSAGPDMAPPPASAGATRAPGPSIPASGGTAAAGAQPRRADIDADTGVVGSASGRISLGSSGGAPVELQPRAAIGVWLPAQNQLRIALLAEAPDHVAARRELEALVAQSSSGPATIEVTFVPTAQAFTADEIDHVRLVVRDADGAQVATDITTSLRWSGSLVSPRDAENEAANRLEFTAQGDAVSADAAARPLAWELATSVPIATR